MITSLLTYLDNHYPDLDGDEARRAIWLVDVPLAATHHLRSTINDGKPPSQEALEQYEIPIVASVLKLYLLELPDSLVSSHVYEIIKTIYSTTSGEGTTDEARVAVIQSTLGQLRLANIATLDALTTHFSRLIELTSADEAYIHSLATALAPCVLRPKNETSLTLNEKYNYRLLRDLFAHKEAIFGELKRASSQAQRAVSSAQRDEAKGARGRGMSTDERGRRDAEQERRQAMLANKSAGVGSVSRAASPGSVSSRMKRERSPNRMSGDATTRFPVSPTATNHSSSGSVTSPTERRSTLIRHSLEVPSVESSPVVADAPLQAAPKTNGLAKEDGLSKRDSLGRASAVTGRRGGGGGLAARQSLYGGAVANNAAGPGAEPDFMSHRGVSLSDRPMDD
jgi:hypothetical protein